MTSSKTDHPTYPAWHEEDESVVSAILDAGFKQHTNFNESPFFGWLYWFRSYSGPGGVVGVMGAWKIHTDDEGNKRYERMWSMWFSDDVNRNKIGEQAAPVLAHLRSAGGVPFAIETRKTGRGTLATTMYGVGEEHSAEIPRDFEQNANANHAAALRKLCADLGEKWMRGRWIAVETRPGVRVWMNESGVQDDMAVQF